ncbi:MAG TPA: RNA pyrophosphohydrolase [Alphaproteobacteria bacterium]
MSEPAPPTDALPYRPCVGIMLLDRHGRAFVGQRADQPGDAWQMPQGGIDIERGEAPRAAALRELSEEIGIEAVEVLAEGRGWHRYDLPEALAGRAWGGRFRGQEQKWFAMRFLGGDEDIDLGAHEREFSRWRWVEPERLPALVVPFKRAVYEAVVAEFRPLFERLRAAPAGG